MALTKISGSVIKDSVSLSGNVSVGGTLTYQDVTNVDAIGLGTFRLGINVSGGEFKVGTGVTIGTAGVITATDFKKADGTSVGAATQVTIGVRSGAAVTFAATGSSFNVINRAGGNVAINL